MRHAMTEESRFSHDALPKSKSWSQQQLAVKLGVDGIAAHGLLNWERKRLLIHAAKTALAAALCWWIALRFGLQDGYWGAISAIIVLQSNFGATITASRDRILGTIIGAAFGFGFSLFGVLPWNFILAVLSAVILCGLLGLRNSSRLAGVTISIVMLVQRAGSHWVARPPPRRRSLPGNRRRYRRFDPGLPRSRTAATARRTCAGVPRAQRILRRHSARIPRTSG